MDLEREGKVRKSTLICLFLPTRLQKIHLSVKDPGRRARVHENKRNSQIRKQEYIQELEQRLVSSKEETKVDNNRHLLAIKNIEAENRHLRTLSKFLGVLKELIEDYLRSYDQDAAAHYKVTFPLIPTFHDQRYLLRQKEYP